jgi:hypothetical protein
MAPSMDAPEFERGLPYRRRLLFLLPPLRMAFLPLLFEDFVWLLALEDFFDFPPLVDLRLADLLLLGEAFAFAVLLLFFAVRLAPVPRFFALLLALLLCFFEATEGFLLRRFALPPSATAFALAATALTAFLAGGAAELAEAAARPTNAPITPPTTAPTGPATLPRTAPVAAPAVCFEIGGISIFSDDELDVSVDRGFSSGITNTLL